jgi:hypothetical protein
MVGSEKYGNKLIICFCELWVTTSNSDKQTDTTHTKCGACLPFPGFLLRCQVSSLHIIISLDAHCKCQRFGGFDGSSGYKLSNQVANTIPAYPS